jgi:hypothetical protein
MYPLNYPDPTGEYYGYERWGTYLGSRTFGPGVRSLVTSVTLMASCCVMLQTGRLVASKQASVSAYQMYIGDEWTEFVQQVYTQCKQAWHYQLPSTAKARRLFRRLCAKMLAFENHFLGWCRKPVLNDLRHPQRAIQQMALYRLKRIAYSGEDFGAALMILKESEYSEIAQGADAVLAKLQSIPLIGKGR